MLCILLLIHQPVLKRSSNERAGLRYRIKLYADKYNTMRQYIDLITEASYDSMITALKSAYPEEQEAINSHVKWAKSVLKRDDRISWYLRLLKAYMVYQSTGKDNLTPLAGISADIFVKSLDFGDVQDMIVHYFGYNIPAIEQYRFARQPVMTVNADFQAEVDKWEKEQQENAPLDLEPGDYELIEFPDGSAWIFADRAYCEREGKSGKHCGNVVGRQRPNQRILSYRVDGRVLMTFILEEDGYLGEMKAKGNQKPAPKLHPYIVELLLDPIVEGIRGGGYLPENNFSIFDLNDQLYKKIQQERPVFISQQLDTDPRGISRLTPEDLKDEHIAIQVVRSIMNIRNLEDIPTAWLDLASSSPYIMRELVLFNSDILLHMDPELVSREWLEIAMTTRPSQHLSNNIGRFPAIDEQLITDIVEYDPQIVAHLPDDFYTDENIKKWIKLNSLVATYLPEEFQTEEMFIKLVKINPRNLSYVPKRFKTYNFWKIAVLHEPRYLKYLEAHVTPEQYKELATLAVRDYPQNIKYVSNDELRKELGDAANDQKKTQLPENSLRRLIDLTSK